MRQTQGSNRVYSESFKRKVVEEIMSGKLTVSGAMKKYDIGGSMTVYRWVRRYGSPTKKSSVRSMVLTPEEAEQSQEKDIRIRHLEHALAETSMQVSCLTEVIHHIDKEYGIDAKKKYGTMLSERLAKRRTP